MRLARRGFDGCEIGGRNGRRERPPAVTVPEQDEKVRPWGQALAALDFTQADVERLLIVCGIRADSPAQVHSLKTRAVPRAELAQPRKDERLQRLALGLQVDERGADEDSKDAQHRLLGSRDRPALSMHYSSSPLLNTTTLSARHATIDRWTCLAATSCSMPHYGSCPDAT